MTPIFGVGGRCHFCACASRIFYDLLRSGLWWDYARITRYDWLVNRVDLMGCSSCTSMSHTVVRTRHYEWIQRKKNRTRVVKATSANSSLTVRPPGLAESRSIVQVMRASAEKVVCLCLFVQCVAVLRALSSSTSPMTSACFFHFACSLPLF